VRWFGRIVIVVDASVLAPALADDSADGDLARTALRGQELTAPELLDLEVASVLRRQGTSGLLSVRRAEQALADLLALPVRRVRHAPLLPRCWELRHNITVYDATYVALAELLDLVLLTADERLTTTPGPRCEMRLLR